MDSSGNRLSLLFPCQDPCLREKEKDLRSKDFTLLFAICNARHSPCRSSSRSRRRASCHPSSYAGDGRPGFPCQLALRWLDCCCCWLCCCLVDEQGGAHPL